MIFSLLSNNSTRQVENMTHSTPPSLPSFPNPNPPVTSLIIGPSLYAIAYIRSSLKLFPTGSNPYYLSTSLLNNLPSYIIARFMKPLERYRKCCTIYITKRKRASYLRSTWPKLLIIQIGSTFACYWLIWGSPSCSLIRSCATSQIFPLVFSLMVQPHLSFTHKGASVRDAHGPPFYFSSSEALSRLIIEEKRQGILQGIKIVEGCILTYILFVDDVLILINGSIGDTLYFFAALSSFFLATSMVCNVHKSTMTVYGFS